MFELLKIIIGLVYGFTGLIILKYEKLQFMEVIVVIGIFIFSMFLIISAVQQIQKHGIFR